MCPIIGGTMFRNIGKSRFEHYGMATKERNMIFALKFLRRTASALGLTRLCLYRSTALYRRASASGLVQGRKIEKVCCACLYYSCKQLEIPCSMDEISCVAGVSQREAMRSYVSLSRKLGLKIRPAGAKAMAARFCSVLRLPACAETEAMRIIRKADASCSPRTLAAAAVYLCSGKTQKEVAGALAVSEVSLRNAAGKLKVFTTDK